MSSDTLKNKMANNLEDSDEEVIDFETEMDEIRKFLSCVTCKKTRTWNMMYYFRECIHMYCSYCLGTEKFCQKCLHMGSPQCLGTETSRDGHLPLPLMCTILLSMDDPHVSLEDILKEYELSHKKKETVNDKYNSFSTINDMCQNEVSSIENFVSPMSQPKPKENNLNIDTVEVSTKTCSPKTQTEDTDIFKSLDNESDKSEILSLEVFKQCNISQEIEEFSLPQNLVESQGRTRKPNRKYIKSNEIGKSPKRSKLKTPQPKKIEIKSPFTSPIKEVSRLKNSRKSAPPKMETPKRRAETLKTPVSKRKRLDESANRLSTPMKKMASPLVTSTPGSTFKKNRKGESPLHLAVKRNQLPQIQSLVETGVEVNEQDFAGWTPLHDAVVKKNVDIISYLLENGALVNVPGLDNQTALHLAVDGGDEQTVQLLLRNGADPDAKDLFGNTPRSLANEKLSSLMCTTKNVKSNVTKMKASFTQFTLFAYKKLPALEQRSLRNFLSMTGAKEIRNIYEATHVIVPKDAKCEVFDWGLVQVMAKGPFIVSSQWCEDSVEKGTIQDLDNYTFSPNWLPGLEAARKNALLHQPGLFSGCRIMLGGSKRLRTYKYEQGPIDLEQLRQFLLKAGAVLLSRVPDPESPITLNTVPYHAPPGPMEKCSEIVIYFPGDWDFPLKYNMEHLKCLPVQWLMNCILNFSIEDPSPYFSTG